MMGIYRLTVVQRIQCFVTRRAPVLLKKNHYSRVSSSGSENDQRTRAAINVKNKERENISSNIQGYQLI
jgi:hypothetical protein